MPHLRQTGPYLRTEEGEEIAVLCNHDELLDDSVPRSNGPDFEVVSPPGTPSRRHDDRLLLPLETTNDQGRLFDRPRDCYSTIEAMDSTVDAGTSRSPETEVVYSRNGVAVWPARKHRIVGRLSLIKQNSVLFFAWLPHNPGVAGVEGNRESAKEASDVATAPVLLGQYAVHPIPLSDLKAVRKHTPKLGNHYVVLILKNGLTLPPFYFGSGGVRSLFSVIKQHAVLTKSNNDAGTYLVNDTEDPLQRSLVTLDLSDVLLVDPEKLPALPLHIKGHQDGEASSHLAFMERMKEGVHRAKQFAKDTTSSLLPPKQHPTAAKSGVVPKARKEKAETGVGLFEMVDRSESESMSSGLSQPCPPPLTQDEWFTFLDSSGKVVDSKALRARIFSGGVEPGIRKEAWKYLLGMYHPEGSTAAYRLALNQKRSAEYECIKAQWTSISDKQAARFCKWRERRVRVDKDVKRTDCSHPFFSGAENPNVAALRRILLTYSMYNFDLGYCQGMSDLATPILYVMRDEAAAFWCFAHLMERMEANFSVDCTGMHTQLAALDSLLALVDPALHAALQAKDCTNFFFCYRWLLVHFKREFSFDEALQLWEALWSCPLTPHFHLYVCVAVLRMHRTDILVADMGLDDLLRFCIELSGRLDLGRTLRCAERLFQAAGEAGVEALRAAGLS